MSHGRRKSSLLFGEDEPQLGLFDAHRDGPEEAVERTREELRSVAGRLPPQIRFGTSSWTFPGWAGLIYHRRYPNQRAFLRESLAEYATHPLMRTVGVDRGYYAPIPEEDLAMYAAQLPEGFRAAVKVWQRIAMPGFPRHPRYGAEAGKDNRAFLDPEIFATAVHQPLHNAFGHRMGPWILEVAPAPRPMDPHVFCRKLGLFLRQAPRDFPFAVELRDRHLLTEEYVRTLREHGACHVFNYWSRMPSLAEQMQRTGLLEGGLVVIRLLLPPGARYDELKKAYAPFDRLVAPQAAMRRDVLRLVREALDRDMETYVLVNNKAEGSSPWTIRGLAEQLVG